MNIKSSFRNISVDFGADKNSPTQLRTWDNSTNALYLIPMCRD